jgi:hypothetical protein
MPAFTQMCVRGACNLTVAGAWDSVKTGSP